MEKKFIIIDGNSIINRAFYAIRNPMITDEGIYTQGIYGFVSMLNKIIAEHVPNHICVTFDMKAPTFRHKEYDQYKAGRKKMPDELAMQFPMIRKVLDARNIKYIELEGFEADDLIGTLSRIGEEEGFYPLIITGDRDALQLATKKTKVLITKKGISEYELYDEDMMMETYGLTPTQFIDYKGLMGDTADNIPGIPGVGKVAASKLLLQFGSMENIIRNTDQISAKGLRKKVEDNVQLAMMSKKLATINKYVPIEVNLDEYKFVEPNKEALKDIYTKLEFRRFLKELNLNDIDSDKKSSKSVEKNNIKIDSIDKVEVTKDIAKFNMEIVNNEKELADVMKKITLNMELPLRIYSDFDHVNLPAIYGFTFLIDKTVYYVCADLIDIFMDEVKKKEPKIVGHEIRDIFYFFNTRGYKNVKPCFDTKLAEYVIDASASKYDFDKIVFKYTGKEIKTDKDLEKEFKKELKQISMFNDFSDFFAEYSKEYFEYMVSIIPLQKEKLERENLAPIYYDLELKLVEVMVSLEEVGFATSEEKLSEIGADVSKRIDGLTEKIYELAGSEFNIKSPKQLAVVLFEDLGLKGSKKTKNGFSTDVEALEKIKNDHEIVELILEYRGLSKLMGTYIDGLIPLISDDNRIHAKFNQSVAATGRISSSEPNLQNIPVRSELGKTIRSAFITEDENYVLVGADYSQIELRVLAHLSQDEALLKSFRNNEDIHRATASRILGVNEDEVTQLQRSQAKAVNFGVIYGMSAFGLSEELDISFGDANKYISDYFKAHPAVKDYMDDQVEFCKQNGYVETILGRKRRIKEINMGSARIRQFGERLAMNSPIQGSAADIIKLAMINVYNNLKGKKSRLILQIHDELIIEAHITEKDEIKTLLKESMENAIKLSVDLDVSLNVGNNWLELK